MDRALVSLLLLMFAPISVFTRATESPGAQSGNGTHEIEMTWVIIGVVGAVAVILAFVFGTYCCGGWFPNCSVCCKNNDPADTSETASLIAVQPSKDPYDNLLQISKPQSPFTSSTDQPDGVTIQKTGQTNSIEPTKLEQLLE